MLGITYTCIKKNSVKKEHTSTIHSIQKKENALKYIYQLISLKKDKIPNNLFNKFFYNKMRSTNYHYKKLLSNTIRSMLLDQYVKKIHFSLSSSFVKKKIQSLSCFRKNNRFNQNKFNTFLKILHISKKEYENFVNVQEAKKKFLSVLEDTDFFTNAESKILMKSFSEHRIISKAKINVCNNKNKKTITLKTIKNYFEKHKSSFFYSEKLKINYIKLDLNKLKTQTNNNELKKWYMQYNQNCFIPEKRKFAIIKTNSKKEAETIVSYLQMKQNFEKIAKKRKKITNYIPVTKENNTYWIAKSSFPVEIQHALLVKKGDISKIICSKKGFFIFKLIGIIPSQKKSVSLIKKTFLPQLTNKEYCKNLHIIKKNLCQEIKDKKNDFKNIAKKFKSRILHATLFSKKNTLKNLINSVLENKILKKINVDPTSSMSNINLYNIDFKHGICYLFNIEKYIPKKQKTISECKKEIENILSYTQIRKKTIMNLKKIIDITPNNKLQTLFNKQFIFSDKSILSQLNISPIQKFSFHLKYKLRNKPVYGVFVNPKGNIFLIACHNVFYSNSLSKENILLLQNYIKHHYSNVFIYNMLHSLEQTSDVENNSKISKNII